MKLHTTIPGVLAFFALALAAPAAAAGPDGYQPQLRRADTSDAFTRFLRNNSSDGYQAQLHPVDASDAFMRYLRNAIPDGYQPQVAIGSAARHPDSVRTPLGVSAPATVTQSSGSFGWDAFGTGLVGGIALAGLGITVAWLGSGRRRLAHR